MFNNEEWLSFSGHLIKTLADYDVTYPTELDHSFRVTDHVTTLSSHTRRRRSVTGESEPIIYQVLILLFHLMQRGAPHLPFRCYVT